MLSRFQNVLYDTYNVNIEIVYAKYSFTFASLRMIVNIFRIP